MWIVNQQGNNLYKVDHVSVSGVFVEATQLGDNHYLVLGEYHSNARCLNIFQQISDCIAKGLSVYRMPTE